MNRWLSFILLLAAFARCTYAQEFSGAIEDNSFFIEEAFNQEDRVVQHIYNGYYLTNIKELISTFTQEWPMGGQTHQLSYTVAYQSFGEGVRGLGDALINYRYQLLDDHDWCWVAPRLSVILPTGKSSEGFGNGVVGLQVSLPASKRLSNGFISHVNIGATILPNVEGTVDGGRTVHRTLQTYSVGTSGIFLLSKNFNLMLELLHNYSSFIGTSGNLEFSHETILSPGLRFAINIGKLQIVPGIAAPLRITSSSSDVNLFAYLSFEHPF